MDVFIGNDLVDLQEERTPERSLNPRFPQRILSESELAAYASSSHPEIFLWQAWAAKETAYKIVKQQKPDIAFSPCAFVWHPDDQAVVWHGIRQPVTLTTTPDYVYAQGSHPATKLYHAIGTAQELLNSDPSWFSPDEESHTQRPLSRAVRLLAKRELALIWGGTPSQWRFTKSPVGQPLADLVGRAAGPLPLSFTHHGRFVAAAFPLPEVDKS